jgi:hypothetical protein
MPWVGALRSYAHRRSFLQRISSSDAVRLRGARQGWDATLASPARDFVPWIPDLMLSQCEGQARMPAGNPASWQQADGAYLAVLVDAWSRRGETRAAVHLSGLGDASRRIHPLACHTIYGLDDALTIHIIQIDLGDCAVGDGCRQVIS